jgi:uncharacterized protein
MNCLDHCLQVSMAVAVGVDSAVDKVAGYPENDALKFRFEQGKDYEELKFAELASSLGSEFVELPDFTKVDQTLVLAKMGKIAIAQAPVYISYDEFDYSARADLLLRSDYKLEYNEDGMLTAVPREGAEVDGLYCVWDVKHSAEPESKKVKLGEITRYEAQLAMSYEALLSMGIGSGLEAGLIYKGDDLARFEPEQILTNLRNKRSTLFARLLERNPLKPKLLEVADWCCRSSSCSDAQCEYPIICAKTKVENDEISQLQALHYTHAPKLKDAGLDTVAKIASGDITGFGFPENSVIRYKSFALCITKAKATGKPEYEVFSPVREEPNALPASTPQDLFIDFETYTPLNKQGKFYYMLGVANWDEEIKQYVADNELEEKDRFFEFVDHLELAISQNPEVHFYHVNHTEATETKALAARHGLDPDRLASLLTHYVDLITVASKSVAVSVGSYGLKKIEKFFPEKVKDGRETDTEDGADSLWQYYRYLKAIELGDIASAESIMKDIKKYNKQDCVSLKHYYNWLASI